jgi:hypothetical protein
MFCSIASNFAEVPHLHQVVLSAVAVATSVLAVRGVDSSERAKKRQLRKVARNLPYTEGTPFKKTPECSCAYMPQMA